MYNFRQTLVQGVYPIMNRLDVRDYALRALIVLSGGVAAVLLTLKGQAQALPALAAGAAMGVVLMTRFGASAE